MYGFWVVLYDKIPINSCSIISFHTIAFVDQHLFRKISISGCYFSLKDYNYWNSDILFRWDKCKSYVLCKLRSKLFNEKCLSSCSCCCLTSTCKWVTLFSVNKSQFVLRNVWYSREDLGTEFTGVVSAPFDSKALNLTSV